jgi:hypothetical protein
MMIGSNDASVGCGVLGGGPGSVLSPVITAEPLGNTEIAVPKSIASAKKIIVSFMLVSCLIR